MIYQQNINFKIYDFIIKSDKKVIGDTLVLTHAESVLQLEFLIEEAGVTKVLYCLPTETTTPWLAGFFNPTSDKTKLNEFLNFLKENKITFDLILGSHQPNFLLEFEKKYFNKHLQIHYWPTLLIDHTRRQLQQNLISESNLGYDIDKLENKKDFKKLYTNYNLRPRIHRRIMMDLLSKNNLLDAGFNSWNKLFELNIGNDISLSDSFYPSFKYWNEEILNLDDYFSEKFNDEFSPELIDTKSFMMLVGETSLEIPYITEKTYRCMYLKQPFIAYGSKNQNKELIKYGFKLYDEIFDYSFDTIDDAFERYQTLLETNIDKLKNKDFNKLYEQIEEKLIFNKKRLFELLDSTEFIPEVIVSLNKKYNKHEY